VAQPAFLRTVVADSTRHVVAATNDLLDSWEVSAAVGDPVNLVPDCMAVTLASLSRTLFGLDVSDERTEILKAVDFGVETMFNRARLDEYLPDWLPTSRNRGIVRHRATLRAMIDRIRADHRREEATVDLVSLLENATDPGTGRPWNQGEIIDELTTIFLAGQETTALALCWTLYTLAIRPDLRERLQAEVDALSGADPVRELSRLPFTKMVIEESLRLHPPIWLYTRDAVGPDEILGYPIAPGSSVLVSPYVTHRRPDLWPNPHVFDPDRFDPAKKTTRARFAYFPFGGGPRQCIGMHLALHELQVMLALIAQRFDFSLVGQAPIDVGELVLSLRPIRDVVVRLTPRSAIGGVPSAA
jgi:cytochrome P450